MTNTIAISSNFDGGNIICHACHDPKDIRLDIRTDNESDFFQWFYFRLTGAEKTACRLKIGNASAAAYPKGWEGYQACASYDREHWFRVPTSYENGILEIAHKPAHGSIYYAYFAPYSMQRHADLIADAQMQPGVSASVLGQTLDGQDIDLLTIGKPGRRKKSFWITARQHPGETMAEWWVEGFLSRLLDDADPAASWLRKKAVIYIVPNMCPDGARRGHLRTNAAGANLNREWGIATLARCPEIYHVTRKMAETGVDFALDVHGDEALPYNFIAGAEGVPGFDDKAEALLSAFKDGYEIASRDFQTKIGYPRTPAGKANLTLATNYIANEFGCLAMTLEMPFKDNANLPNKEQGWSPERAMILGRDALGPMASMLGRV